MAKVGRKEADSIAGEEIIFHNEKSKVQEVEGMVPADKKCIAPLFNLVSSQVELRVKQFLNLRATSCRRTTRM